MLGKKLITLRKEKNMTQEVLASELGVTRQTISNWELNETFPSAVDLKKISSIFNISIDELLDNDTNNIIVSKVSNTERLAGIIINILKGIGILFIIFILFLIISIIMLSVFRSNSVNFEETHVELSCELDGEEYSYSITYNDNGIKECGGDEFINNLVEDKNFNLSGEMIKYIEDYFIKNGGSC